MSESLLFMGQIGKTAILRILNSFLNSQYSELKGIPFKNFRVEFDNSSGIEINLDIKKIEFNFFELNSEVASFRLPILKQRENLPSYNNYRQINEQTDSFLKSSDSSNEGYTSGRELKHRLKSKPQEEPDWLDKLKHSIHIRLIESQRLLNFVPNYFSKKNRGTHSMISTVSAYSQELAKLMQDKFQEYGKVSQSLDRTFPMRVVKQQPSADITDEQLRHKLNELEATRSRLIEVGLLDKDEDSEFQIQPQDIDESTKNALSVYVEDVEKKLSVFDDIASKIDLLKRIINNKFAYSYKEISFSKEKGFIFNTLYNSSLSNSKTLSATDLSSGEQHELVLLYELLFKVKPNTLVLIDEPEISLHVGWQIQFLKDLQEITKLADIDILMATHSPDIIQDRWDLTVELKSPEK